MRKWWMILIMMILGGGIGYLSIFIIKPMYKADTYLSIINRDKVVSSESLNSFEQLIRQYYKVIYSRSLITAVLSNIDNFYTTEEEFMKIVSIDSEKDSNIIVIKAKYSEPTIVAAIANTTGREFITQIQQLTNTDNIVVLDEALVPDKPVSNNIMQKILLGVLTGFMVSIGAIYIIEYLHTTVRSAEDIENGLNLRVIGIIPEYDIK
jgi:capsular polysaccharide biosynthesis protein